MRPDPFIRATRPVPWAAAGGVVVSQVYGLWLAGRLGLCGAAPDLLILQIYLGIAGAVVAGGLMIPAAGLMALRGRRPEPLEASSFAMGFVGFPLLLHVAAAGIKARTLDEPILPPMGIVIALSVLAMAGLKRALPVIVTRVGPRRSLAVALAALTTASIVVSLPILAPEERTARRSSNAHVASRPDRPRPPRRILWYSIDGATWKVIRPLIESGKLPTLARLVREGSSGLLVSEKPGNSSALVTTQSTGRPPRDHGILALLELEIPGLRRRLPLIADPEDHGGPIDAFYLLALAAHVTRATDAIPPTSASRRVKAIWNILDEAGLSSLLVGWVGTWPAEPLTHGRIVSDRFGFSEMEPFFHRKALPNLTHPAALAAQLESLLIPPENVPEGLLSMADWTDADRAGLASPDMPLFATDSRTFLKLGCNWDWSNLSILHRLLDDGDEQPVLTAIHLSSADAASHIFWEYAFPGEIPRRPPPDGEVARYGRVIERVYARLDAELAALLRRVAPETVVIVSSDHGIDTTRHVLGWGSHSLEGVFVAWRPGVIRSGVETTMTAYEMTPLILHLLGRPRSLEMTGRVPVEILEEAGDLATIASYES